MVQKHNTISQCFINGKGIEKSLEKALNWYQKAAKSGYIRAQYFIAALYKEGTRTKKDLEKAIYW